MMDGGKYASGTTVSGEKIAASVLVALWLALTHHMGGIPFAGRAALLFAFPLTFLWIPDLMARLTNEPSRRYGPTTAPVGAKGLRIVAWLVILGVPAAWWAFHLAAAHG